MPQTIAHRSIVVPASLRSGVDERAARSCGPPRLVEVERGPGQRERAGGDRAARDARDAVEARQPAGLVQPPQRAEVEQHRPVAAAGEAQRDAVGRLVRAHGRNPKRRGSGAWISLRKRSSARPRVGPMLPIGIPSGRADHVVARLALGMQQAQQRALLAGEDGQGLADGGAPLGGDRDLLLVDVRREQRVADLVAGGDDPLAALQHAQALAPRGGGDPGAEALGVAQAADVLDGAQPGQLGDILAVGLAQTVRTADGADEHGVAVDELLPGLGLAGGRGLDERRGVALPALRGSPIGQGRDGRHGRDLPTRALGPGWDDLGGMYHRACRALWRACSSTSTSIRP